MGAEMDSLELQVETSAKGANRVLNNMAEKLSKIKDTLGDIADLLPALGKVGDTSALEELKTTTADIEKALEKVAKHKVKPRVDRSDLKYVSKDLDEIFEKFKRVGKDTSVDDMGMVELQKKITSTEKELDRLNARLDKKLDTENVSTYGKAYVNLVYDIQKATNALEVYREALSSLKGKAPEIKIDRGASDYKPYETPEAKQMAPDSGNYDASAMKAVYGTSDIKNFNDAVEKLGGNAKQAMSALNSMNGSFDSSKAASYEMQIAKLRKELADLQKQGLGQGNSDYDRVAQELATVTERLRQYKAEAKKTAKVNIAEENDTKLGRLSKKLGEVSSKAKEFGKTTKSALGSLSKFASSCGALGNMLMKPISMIGRLTGSITGLRNQTNKGMSWGRMIGSSILFSTVFGAISTIKQAIVDGSNNLVQYSTAYNNTISSIVTSLLYLKNAWAAAFSPIISVVAPYLTRFIDMLAGALNKVGQFFSVLTGKSMAVQAKKVWKDYGRTLESTGTSANKAANGLKKAKKAAKEFQTYTLGIDELNVQPKQSKSSDTGNTGSTGSTPKSGKYTGPDPSTMFETVKPKKAISDYAKRLREAFKAHDWEKLGAIMAEGVNKGMLKLYNILDWNKNGAKITYFINAFTTTMNSFTDRINWSLIGGTVANGINTIAHSFNLLAEGYNFEALGENVGLAIMNAIRNIEWKNLGNAIGNYFMISWRFAVGVVRQIQWDELGTNLAIGFNGMFEKIDLGTVGETVGRIVGGIITAFKNFVAKADWGEVAKQLKDGIKSALKYASNGGENNGTIAAMLGIGIGAGALKGIGTLATTLEKLSPGIELLKKLKKGLNFEGILEKLSPITNIFSKIGTGIGNLVTKFLNLAPVQSIITKVGTVLGNLATKFAPITNFLTKIGGLVSGLPTGVIIAAIALIAAMLINLWNTSKTFRDNVKAMIDMIVDALSEAKTMIWDETILPLWDNLKEFFASLVEMYESTGMKDKFELIATIIGSVLATAITIAIKVFATLFKTVGGVLSGILTTLTGVIKFVTGVFTGNWKLAWTGVKNIVKGIGKAIGSIFSGLWKTITSIFEPIAEWFTKLFKKAWSGIKSAFASAAKWARGVWKDITNVFSGAKKWFGETFSHAAHAVWKAFSNVGNMLKKIANGWLSLIEGAVNGIIKGVNRVLGKLGSNKKLSPIAIERLSVKKHAKGSNGIPEDTVGMVNDQPGRVYKELIVPPNGKPFIPEGRNVVMPLQKGTKILPANKTAALTESMPHFKKGIGDFVSGAWEKAKGVASNIFEYASHPSKLLQLAINKFVSTNGWIGTIGAIAGGAVKTIFGSAKDFIAKMLKKLGGVGLEKACNWAVGIANDDSHGYDQKHRWGTPDYDCSSLVISAFQKAGINLKKKGAWSTKNLLEVALKSGFKDVTSTVNLSSAKGMRRGDILLRKGHHVALYLGNGKAVAAHKNEKGSITGGKPGDQTGHEIDVYPYSNSHWTHILRYTKGFAKGIGTIGLGDLPKYSTGGFPENGLFMANSNELVGKFGGKNAVVNNYQIEGGIEEATYRGFMRAHDETNNDSMLREILQAIKAGKSIQIDGREIVRAYDSRKSRNGFSFT